MPVYEHVADFIVDVDGRTAEESAAAVIETLKEAYLSAAEKTDGAGVR